MDSFLMQITTFVRPSIIIVDRVKKSVIGTGPIMIMHDVRQAVKVSPLGIIFRWIAFRGNCNKRECM